MIEATVKETEPLTVAYLPMRGEYAQIPDGYRQLYEWIDHYGLQPAGMPEAVYLTAPETTPQDEAMWELWAPVAPGLAETEPSDDRIGVKLVAQETVASTVHRGPYDALGSVYEELTKWTEDNGYTMIGPPREVYLTGPDTPQSETLTEIQFPIQRVAWDKR